jgi:hypothetical protein
LSFMRAYANNATPLQKPMEVPSQGPTPTPTP